MNYSAIKNCDIANGPGVRVSLFVSGCTLHCKGCFNNEAWDFDAGKPFTDEVVRKIIEMLRPSYIAGLSILGGEPLDFRNRCSVLKLLWAVRSEYGDTKSIWVFTGYTYYQAEWVSSKTINNIFAHIDVLVDGPFVEEKKNLSLNFRGSENQRLIDMKKTLNSRNVVMWEEPADPMKEKRYIHLYKNVEEDKNAIH